MRICTIFLLFILSLKVCAQGGPVKSDSLNFTSKLKSVAKNSTLVIAYRQYSYWDWANPWQVLAVSSEGFITKYNADTNFANLRRLDIKQDSLKKTLDLFYQSGIFKMNGTQDWLSTCDSCSFWIYDGSDYSFLISTKTEFINLYFYEPGYFFTCCSRLFKHEKIVEFIRKLFWN
jgi:hypothetical protein